jgi:rhodanese-related sulfurtransferase|tara:strand:- start:4710 stop:4895 length:186 start_codon:yes stop_codon:yes gene_type:complete
MATEFTIEKITSDAGKVNFWANCQVENCGTRSMVDEDSILLICANGHRSDVAVKAKSKTKK